MKIAKLRTDEGIFYAEEVQDGYRLINGDIFGEWSTRSELYFGKYQLMSPVEPAKIVAFGANYAKHAEELNLKVNTDPTIFLKPPTAVIACCEDIIIPSYATKVDYEAELAIVIGKEGKDIPKSEAYDYILGFTCANDVTERSLQTKDGQWTRAKGFDTFCPLGPVIATELDGDELMLTGRLNGKIVQESSTSFMISKIEEMVSFVSGVMTLKPGDVILTGTPAGIGELKAGDTFEVEIEGIGKLTNKVREASINEKVL